MINEGGDVSMLHQVTKKEGVVSLVWITLWKTSCFPNFSVYSLNVSSVLDTLLWFFHHSVASL